MRRIIVRESHVDPNPAMIRLIEVEIDAHQGLAIGAAKNLASFLLVVVSAIELALLGVRRTQVGYFMLWQSSSQFSIPALRYFSL